MDLINRQEVIDTIKNADVCMAWNGEISAEDAADIAVRATKRSIVDSVEDLPSAQPQTCEGCKHLGKWENEVEYGYPSPCTRCKRRAEDHYER